jgi:hypothetical protein
MPDGPESIWCPTSEMPATPHTSDCDFFNASFQNHVSGFSRFYNQTITYRRATRRTGDKLRGHEKSDPTCNVSRTFKLTSATPICTTLTN